MFITSCTCMYMYCHKASPCPYLPTPPHHFNQINWINLIKTQMQLLWFLWWLVFIHNYLISEMIKNNRLGIFFICWRAILHCTDSYIELGKKEIMVLIIMIIWWLYGNLFLEHDMDSNFTYVIYQYIYWNFIPIMFCIATIT